MTLVLNFKQPLLKIRLLLSLAFATVTAFNQLYYYLIDNNVGDFYSAQ